MTKMLHVALREFLATVATKGFLIGMLAPPIMIGLMSVLMPRLMKNDAPKIQGEVAVADPTGAIVGRLETYLSPEAIAERRDALRRRAEAQTPEALRKAAQSAGAPEVSQALDAVLGEVPILRVVPLPGEETLEAAKDVLRKGEVDDGGRLAVVSVHGDAVTRPEDARAFGTYDLYVREKLDDRIEDEIHDGLREALVDARVEAQGLDRDQIEAVTRVPRVRSITVTEGGEKKTNQVLNLLLPVGFMGLLLISVMTGGQYLLTTTIEEKSSRIVEVLLSAVSPMQLMTGKILGQMAVGFLILGLYAGMGVLALLSFAMLGVLDLSLLLYLGLFYVLAYFLVASFMAAVGAAVNEMREAQTLMTPAMIVIMVPWLLWMPITRDPNGTFAVVTSLVPPINTFVMMLRLTSTTPPPAWQVWLSIAISVVSVYVALRVAAKIFRIGLLMFGKAPNFATMLRWVKMA